ncbi:MAG: hypothetical protein ACXWKC_13920 [Xanthobacteraceae bacterium]
MARLVKEYGVPAGIIGKMVVTPPDEMVWLSPNDLRSMGTTMTGVPAQSLSPQTSQTTPQPGAPPMQLGPGSDTSASMQKAQPKITSGELASAAVKLSSQQNGGHAVPARSCQPELKVCTTAISWTAKDGQKLFLRLAEDMNGKMISREFCEINSFGDVRLCHDWDSGEKHRDMKNNNGDWYKVADE